MLSVPTTARITGDITSQAITGAEHLRAGAGESSTTREGGSIAKGGVNIAKEGFSITREAGFISILLEEGMAGVG